MGETVKIRKRVGTFPEVVAGLNGYKAAFDAQGVAEVDPIHALHFLQFPRDYQVAKEDAAKLPAMSAYHELVKAAKPAPVQVVKAPVPIDPDNYLSVAAGNVQPETFADEEWFEDDAPVSEEEASDETANAFSDYVDPDTQTETDGVTCEGCGKAFKSENGLRVHQRTCKGLTKAE